MNCGSTDLCPGEVDGVQTHCARSNSGFYIIQNENKLKKSIQLEKLQDPQKDEHRKKYVEKVSRFGELLLNDNIREVETLLAEDCEAFLFNFAEIAAIKYCNNHDEVESAYKDTKIVKREVKETFVDVAQAKTFQICYYEIMNLQEQSTVSQFSFETFSFDSDQRISKYVASFACLGAYTQSENPFEPSRKDRMLAKVKEINYAWMDQPDLEKIASLLHETTEYKIWRWHDLKTFTLHKNDFVSGFKGLEENYAIKYVVPYELYSEGQYVIATYVYHLEGKNELSGKKFDWLCTCIYTFDKTLNIAKVTQQGELNPEDEVLIPFEVYSRDRLKQKILDYYESKKNKWDGSVINSGEVNFSFEICRFSSSDQVNINSLKGFSDYDRLSQLYQEKKREFESVEVVDVFVDHNSPGYDIAIFTECVKGTINRENYKYSGVEMTFYSIKKLCFENGKIAKIHNFFSEISEEIPSPYDDQNFSTQNIRCKRDMIK